MKQRFRVIVLGAAIAAGTASSAAAQASSGTRAYVDINAGVQVQSRTTASASSFALYGEPASVSSSATIGSGPVFDVGAGYRFGSHFGAGVSLSIFNHGSDATVDVSIPSPLFYNSYTTTSSSATGLRHSEVATNVKLVYFHPIGNTLEVSVSGGPSFVHVSHAVASATVAAGSTTATVTSSEEKGTGVGGNVAATIMYLASSRFGVGFFVNYTGASVDLPSVSGLKVGGLQTGGGVRIRF